MSMSKSINKYPKSDIFHWKYIWNDILSDPEFRNWLVGENMGYYQIFKNNKIKDESDINSTENDKMKGTFYLKFGKLGHYVAYEMQISSIKIFDSSHKIGIYSGCLPDFINSIEYNFGLPVEYELQYNTPQCHKDDSFCQTYSLSYLSNDISLHANLQNAMFDPISSLFNICKIFINNPVFEEICIEQETWINKNLSINKAPSKWNAQYLLDYSKNMDINMFSELFGSTRTTSAS